MSAESAVQAALFQTIGTLGLTVHDVAPQRGAGGDLFVTVGEVVFAPLDTKDRNGFDFVARIHVRAETGNMLPVKDAQGLIYRRLHHGDLTITGYRLILLRREMSDVIREAQGQIHGVCEYRGLIEAI